MGVLKGDVDLIGLAHLLQGLSENGRQGVLTLFRGMDRKSIHFGPQGMRLLDTTMRRPNKLGRILVRRRRLAPSQLKSMLEEQKRAGVRLGELLVHSKLVTGPAIDEALREQIEEEIFDMFLWEGAAFEFHEGPPKKGATGPLSEITFDANITSVLLEAARRADELALFRKLLSDEEMILARTTHEIFADLLGDDLECVDAIFPIIDAKRRLREVVALSIFPRFATLRALYRLINLGFVKPVSPSGSTVLILPRGKEKLPQLGTDG
jgi:hypothetical protein